jgi:hypothetical protein
MESTSAIHQIHPQQYTDTIHAHENVRCVLIDVAVSGDKSVIKIEAEKILKYEDLVTEIYCMWIAEVIPLTTGATETISESLRQYVNNIPRDH